MAKASESSNAKDGVCTQRGMTMVFHTTRYRAASGVKVIPHRTHAGYMSDGIVLLLLEINDLLGGISAHSGRELLLGFRVDLLHSHAAL